MPDTTDQLIFHIGVEGGSTRFFRHKINRVDYEYSFIVSGGDIFDDETTGTGSTTSARFSTLEKAILAFSPSNDWVFFHPVFVHYAYREQVWNLREQMIATLPREVERAHPAKRIGRWERACRTARIEPGESRANRPTPSPFDRRILAAAVAIVEHLKGETMTADEADAFKKKIFESIETHWTAERERNRSTRQNRQQPPIDESGSGGSVTITQL